jgi:hypothetical protein
MGENPEWRVRSFPDAAMAAALQAEGRKEAKMTSLTEKRPVGGHPCWTSGYGARHCEGYRVVGPQGWSGYVEEVRLDDLDAVRAIVVGGNRRLVLPAALIESIDVDSEVVRLRGARAVAAPLRDPDELQAD